MTTSKARQYYVSEETRKTLSDIGGGNYSKGIRISAAYHERLVEALKEVLEHLPETEGWTFKDMAIDEGRALLTEIEEAGK